MVCFCSLFSNNSNEGNRFKGWTVHTRSEKEADWPQLLERGEYSWVLQLVVDFKVFTLAWMSYVKFTRVHVRRIAAEEIRFLWLCFWVLVLNSMPVSTPAGSSLWISRLGAKTGSWPAVAPEVENKQYVYEQPPEMGCSCTPPPGRKTKCVVLPRF